MYSSVVIPTYNRRKILEKTIYSLLNQTLSTDKYEIIVVDDCSCDDTLEYMSKIVNSNSNVTFIRHQQNKGRVITRNDGIKTAKGDLIIFLDDDNVPRNNFVEEHIKCYAQNHNGRIAVIGNASYALEVIGDSNFAKYLQSRYLGNRLISECSTLDYNNLPARCLGTLNCSILRVDLIEVGMFDNRFRHYGGEDEYLGYCLKEKGIRLIFGEKACTLHYDNLSIPRYKQKILESAKHGLAVLKNISPEYIQNTQVKYLIPISTKKDRISVFLAKVIIRVVLNSCTIYFIEHWMILTDRIPFVYCASLYRMLIAGWLIQGQKLKLIDGEFVSYKPEVKKSQIK